MLAVGRKKFLDRRDKICWIVHEDRVARVRDFEAKLIQSERGPMIVVDFFVAVGDAQGANMVNTLAERLVGPEVVDLGHESFESFFAVTHQIGFVEEARRVVAEKVMLTTKRPVLLVKPERLHVTHIDEADVFLSAR